MSPAPYLPSTHIPGINGASGVDNPTRRDNCFIYESPSLGGLKLSAMVSLGEQTKLNEETSNKLGNSYAAQAVYRKGAFGIGFTYTYQNMAGKAPMISKPLTHMSLSTMSAPATILGSQNSTATSSSATDPRPWIATPIQISQSTAYLPKHL